MPFGSVGSLYGFDVEITLSASSFVWNSTVVFVFGNVMVPVESDVLLNVKATVVVSPSRFDVPFHVPATSAAVRAGGGGGGGGAAAVVSAAGCSFFRPGNPSTDLASFYFVFRAEIHVRLGGCLQGVDFHPLLPDQVR